MIVHGFAESGSIIRVEFDGVEYFVPDVPENAFRQLITDWEAEGNTIPAYVPPTGTPTAYQLYKSIFINRLTEAEAVTLEAVLAAADAKLRLMFNSVEYFVSDDPLFATLHAAVAGALGETRAEELLAPGDTVGTV